MTDTPEQNRVEQLAEYLCSEFDFSLDPCVGYYWPEHPNDDGYRGDGGWVKLQPPDVQAYARENAARILAFLSTSKPVAEAVKVKPLNWAPYSAGMFFAPCIVGEYLVHPRGHWWLKGENTQEAGSIDDAKGAAQADYEQRIMSALSTPAQPEGQRDNEVERLRRCLENVRANLVRLAWEENSIMIEGIDAALRGDGAK